MLEKDDLKARALKWHAKNRGKIATLVTTPINNKEDLSLAYTPGVAEPCREIAKDVDKVFDYTAKGHMVAVVTDGSAVLGLGNIGAEASLPVMEGKAALFKTFANLDAFPLALKTQDPSEIIRTVKLIAPMFGGINLEDISAPRCFEIEDALQDIGIPVMHDDQHGTAVVVLAGLLNALKLAGKKLSETKIVIIGAGAAGNGIAQLIADQVKDLILIDSKGVISSTRKDLDPHKKQLLTITNRQNVTGGLSDAIVGADVFIGVSKPNLLRADDIKKMADKPIVFAMANPDPEILPDDAKKAGAFIVATGRSDFPNQVNNSLAFPGIFKGALEVRAPRITKAMKLAAAMALAGLVTEPKQDKIIPGPFEPGISDVVARAVAGAAKI